MRKGDAEVTSEECRSDLSDGGWLCAEQSQCEGSQGAASASLIFGESRAALLPVSLMPKCVFEDFLFHHARPHEETHKNALFFGITRTNPAASLREITSLCGHTLGAKKSLRL
jgi:hypothetical protein